jgi:hypothetical protein
MIKTDVLVIGSGISGHSSLRVTETYLKPFGNELVDKANRQLIASVRKCKWKNETEYRAGL